MARIAGYARRFWQASPDHRGTPAQPGRVVTLVDAPGQETWGKVFLVDDSAVQAVLEDLDQREVAGYERLWATAFDRAGEAVGEVLTYRATESNPNYLGPAPLADMVAQIVSSRGPSGPNSEYVLRLAQALREMGIRDGHVEELAAGVVAREG